MLSDDFVSSDMKSVLAGVLYKCSYCVLRGRIKGYNSSITTIMCQGGSYRTVVG